MTSIDLLPVIFTIIGVGIALGGSILTVMLVSFRMLNQRIVDSETRFTQRIIESEARLTQLIGDSEARLTQLIGDSEARLTQRTDSLESRMLRVEQESAEIKGMLSVIRDALPLRVGN